MKNSNSVKQLNQALEALKAEPGSPENTLAQRAVELAKFRAGDEFPAVDTPAYQQLNQALEALKAEPGSPENTLAQRAVEEALFRYGQHYHK